MRNTHELPVSRNGLGFCNASVKIIIIPPQVQVCKINMGRLKKPGRSNLLNLCLKPMLDSNTIKKTIPVLIKMFKNSKNYEEDFIKDQLKIIMLPRHEKSEAKKEEKKLNAEVREMNLNTAL